MRACGALEPAGYFLTQDGELLGDLAVQTRHLPGQPTDVAAHAAGVESSGGVSLKRSELAETDIARIDRDVPDTGDQRLASRRPSPDDRTKPRGANRQERTVRATPAAPALVALAPEQAVAFSFKTSSYRRLPVGLKSSTPNTASLSWWASANRCDDRRSAAQSAY